MTVDRSPQAGAPKERGAVLVEMSLIASILVTLVLGVYEIGMAWSDHQTVTQASRSGARVGSQLGSVGGADAEILRAVEANLGDLVGEVDRIVVFEADINGQMPVACVNAAVGYAGAGNCNVYDGTSLGALGNLANWGSGAACGILDANWCAASERSDNQDTATYLGVSVEIERSYLTGLFGGGTHSMSEITVMRLEPRP